jgi:predicted RNA binding protein YcfA (HicA-like mRNA interferase family)
MQNIKSKEVVKILERNGFEIKRQNGTHIILRKNEKVVVVPVHHQIMPIGTLKSIEKQAGINFRNL